MFAAVKKYWKWLRSHFWAALAFDVLVIAAVFLAVSAWQARNLPIDEPAPQLVLPLLDGSGMASAITPGSAGIVYFFAPWCFYCRHSIGNLDKLVAGGRVAWGVAVALSYGDPQEVRDFVKETGVSLPVLLGSPQTTHDWPVPGFPTYYVIDAQGRIASRSVGYATGRGMRIRYWLAR